MHDNTKAIDKAFIKSLFLSFKRLNTFLRSITSFLFSSIIFQIILYPAFYAKTTVSIHTVYISPSNHCCTLEISINCGALGCVALVHHRLIVIFNTPNCSVKYVFVTIFSAYITRMDLYTPSFFLKKSTLHSCTNLHINF